MGSLTAYLQGQKDLESRIIKYLKHRKEGVAEMLKIGFKRSGEINPIILEVLFTYSAIIRDIKNDRLD